MNTNVRSKSRCSCFSRFSTCACTDTSSADTGSSQTISLGRMASARAMPMRCALAARELVREAVVVLRVQADDLEQLLHALA